MLLQVANLIWAFATMQFVPSPAFLEALCARATRDLHQYSPQNISNTCWALATLGHTSKVCAAGSCAAVTHRMRPHAADSHRPCRASCMLPALCCRIH